LDAIFFRLDGNVRTHLDTVLGRKVWAGSAGRLESRPNPRTGMSALRSAGFPACGFWGLSSPQLSRCARNVTRSEFRPGSHW